MLTFNVSVHDVYDRAAVERFLDDHAMEIIDFRIPQPGEIYLGSGQPIVRMIIARSDPKQCYPKLIIRASLRLSVW